MLELIERKNALRGLLCRIKHHSCWTKFSPTLQRDGIVRMKAIESGLEAAIKQIDKIKTVAGKMRCEECREILRILREEVPYKDF